MLKLFKTSVLLCIYVDKYLTASNWRVFILSHCLHIMRVKSLSYVDLCIYCMGV